VASSEALSTAFAEPETETFEAIEVDAVNEAVAEDAPAAETDKAPLQEQGEPTVSEPAVIEEPLAVTATAQTLVEGAPEQHSDSTAGVTEAGRAVNDPRIAPKPATDTSVSTELGELFATPQAPPVTVVQQDVSRASNDPRGPRAA
jgi:ribonuclease E